jgi:starch synthase
MKERRQPIRAALISSEMAPFAKTGGLADAVAGLSRALADAGHEVAVLLPKYRDVAVAGARGAEVELEVAVAGVRLPTRVARIGVAENLDVCLVDIPELFDRPGLYGDATSIYADNLLRFSAFSRASLQFLRDLEPGHDLVHAHDWQAALVPLLLKTEFAGDPRWADARSLLTIHNLAYQGHFPAHQYAATGLPDALFDVRYTEFHGGVNLLKGGIVAADAITTVSPTYAREVLHRQEGAGLDGVLRDRREHFVGIINGIDARLWNPATDPFLPFHYRAGAPQGKGKCKRALLEEVGLSSTTEAPLIGIVSRFVTQKGIDLLPRALPRLLDTGARWVILGTGDAAIEEQLRALAARHAEQIAVRVGFDEGLAHRIQGGSDYLLMPSRFEPCGLNQMYALRYGTVPIVSRVGGLADTVTDVDESGDATGFLLSEVSVDGVVEGVRRALAWYRKPRTWASLRRRGLESDFSWPRSARRYAQLYRQVLEAPPAAIPPGPAGPTAT